mmetsp:Transcript_126791/g.253512  ORF Transcript_126791/g.253512 Transcript_126791/m.253512 type:complete len:275 (+) Transcript_126791:47-871(+)
MLLAGERRLGSSAPTVAALAAGSALALLLAALARRKLCAQGDALTEEEREKLLTILVELSKRFYNVCLEVAHIAGTVRFKIQASQVEITEEKLQQQLSRQCQVFEKLQKIEAEVAEQFGCTSEDVRILQQRAARDPRVRSYEDGFKTMLNDALAGILPILPNTVIPQGLTEEKALQIQAEVHAVETKYVLESVGGSKCTLKKLGEVLTTSQKLAWEETMKLHADLIPGGVEVFHSALATYARNADFAQERKKLQDAHQEKMVKLFQVISRDKAP